MYCKLCQQSVPKLESSHYLPAAIYRGLREGNAKNPNPVLLSRTRAVQTSTQLKARLLCQNCEQRFSTNGERWVFANFHHAGGAFPLAALLASRFPDATAVGTSTKLYYADSIAGVDVAALTYFAASIFWRGAIYPWRDDGSVPVQLGPFFGEELRKYLMGLQPFPRKYFSLLVVVREGACIDRLAYAPVARRVGGLHSYRFVMPGFFFLLFVSKNLPVRVTEMCFAGGARNPLYVTDALEEHFFNEGVALLRRAKGASSVR